MVIKEDSESVSIVSDPLAKCKPTITPKDDIDARKKSKHLDDAQRLAEPTVEDEILDLIAYVYAKADKLIRMRKY